MTDIHKSKLQKMTPTQELIRDLKAAIANKEDHNQKVFFNECGTAACIAGQKMERDVKNKVIGSHFLHTNTNCWVYARKAYNLSVNMGDLIFSENANYITHQLAIILLERGLESKFTSCDYMNHTSYKTTSFGYDKSNFTLKVTTVKENIEDTFKLLTDIATEIGANLHKYNTPYWFILECGMDFKFSDIDQILFDKEC